MLVVEIVGAWLSGSLALLADAGHMFSDLAGLIIALTATVVAARPATDRQTFGYQRAEVFGALLNGLILLAVGAASSSSARSPGWSLRTAAGGARQPRCWSSP